jgi:quinoprotein glucose dehydrogenase
MKKKIILISIFSLFLIFSFNYRFEIMYYGSTTLGYDKNKAERYSFIFTHKPFAISKAKLRQFFNPKWQEKERLELAIEAKKNFVKHNFKKMNSTDNKFFLEAFDNPKINTAYQNVKLEYSNIWENRYPQKIWNINISNNKILDKPSLSKETKAVQSAPKMCGEKLVYARLDGTVGAVDYRTGKRFWHKKYGNKKALSIRGFFCEYDKELKTFVIILPTGSGVYCINSLDGSLFSKRCGGKKMGVYESRVSPQLEDKIVYVATIKPAGLEAYDFFSGNLLWRKDFEVGKSFYIGKGSNPWSNFIIDKKKKIIFINIGSPDDKFALRKLDHYKFSGSLLALDLKKGDVIWQFQEHKKDTWNHDFVGQPILSPIKVNGKDVVITLSKSGSSYFIDRDTGLSVFPINEKKISFAGFNYSYKKSIFPESLLDKQYYNYLGKNCKDCDLNTTIFGQVPTVLKTKRIFDGYLGGFQWPGATIDYKNNYLIVTSNHNFIVEQYHDIIPSSLSALPKNELVQQCTSCHNSSGNVEFRKNMKVPSLFLTTKIYELDLLNRYLKNNQFHKKIEFTDNELSNAYKALKKYDNHLIKNKNYKYFVSRSNTNLNKKRDKKLKRLSLGKISAISLNNGKIVWQIPAGTYKLNQNETIIGSQNSAGVTSDEKGEGVSFFTGSYDKKVYAINNTTGKYLWSDELAATGSALPLIYNNGQERWIFFVSGGRNPPKSRANNIVAFMQKSIIK